VPDVGALPVAAALAASADAVSGAFAAAC